MPSDLGDDVRGGPEAVEPEPLCVPGEVERAVADQAGAEERRGLLVRVAGREREAVARVRDRLLRIAAVDVVAGEARVVAEILLSGAAVAAFAVRPREPRNADARAFALALDHGADDLVAEDERQLRVGELAVSDVQIGAANAAGVHAQAHLSGAELGPRQVSSAQRRARRIEHHRPHVRIR